MTCDGRLAKGTGRGLAIANEALCTTTEIKELRDIVRKAISRLPEEQRQAVELVYFKGCTQRDRGDLGRT